jgi:hypothetical protein
MADETVNQTGTETGNGTAEVAADSSGEALAQLQRDMANLKQGLGLLGVKPCAVCGKYHSSADPGNLFTAGCDSVCYSCLSGWGPGCCSHLDLQERESIEYRLKDWLVKYHHAKVCRESRELPPKELQDIHIVVACRECKRTGVAGGERCRHCLGNRTVWVVTMK